jgi:hypothetical protein
MRAILSPAPVGPVKPDAWGVSLFAVAALGLALIVLGIYEIGGLFILGSGFVVYNVATWVMLWRSPSAV